MPKGKLRNKIFFLMLFVSVVPVIVAGFLSVYSITLSHKVEVANLEGAIIDQNYRGIKNPLHILFSSALQIATTYEQTSDIDIREKRGLGTQIISDVKDLKDLEDLSFLNLDGKETARFTRTYPGGVPETELRDQSWNPKFLSVKEFLTAKEGKDYVGPVYFTLKGPMMTAASYVRNKNNVVVAFTAGEINLTSLKKTIEEAKIGTKGYLYLVDQDGFVIGGGPDGNFPKYNVKGTGFIGDILAGKDFLTAEGQRRYENFFGEKVVAAGKFLPEYGWALIAEWPVSEADASVNDILYKNILVSLAVVVAVILASILLATFIVRPIRALEEGTEKVAQGKFDEGINIKTGDELEELGDAFNKMMAGLKRLEELKEEFVFIAAHELRTPVAAMKGYLSLIRDGITGPITDKTKEFIQNVIHANDRLVQLVNDLLEVSRSEAGRLTIKVSPIDIVAPIREVLKELEKMADEHKVQVAYEPFDVAQGKPQMPNVLADSDRVKEVLVNLVGNSIKYMGGSGAVTIYHETKEGMLLTHVKDTGLGMSDEAQKKLFEKFYRVATDKTREITGTGLGLFIVKEIIEKMGGKVSAYSAGEGQGSIFSFSLPIAG